MNLVLQVPRAFLPPEWRVEGATLPVRLTSFAIIFVSLVRLYY